VPIHPALAAKLPLLEGIPSWPEGHADPEMRIRLQEFEVWPDARPAADVDVRTETAPGPHGPIPLRVYSPPGSVGTDRFALVWMHGGAFMFGDLDMVEADGVAREVCARAGAVVVCVDYRLAVGGVTYPVPHDDVVAAIRWVRDSAVALGVDPARITVGGASAGGNLAAGATLRLRDDDGWAPAALLLAYTTTHAVVPPATPALAGLMQEVPRLLRFLPEDRAWITRNYLGGAESRADGYAMPARAELAGLCEVVLLNAEYDDLRASSETFAAQLAVVGVDVRQVLVRGMLHGFLNLPASIEPIGRALDLMAEVVAGDRAPVPA
jgi:acetyl esterase